MHQGRACVSNGRCCRTDSSSKSAPSPAPPAPSSISASVLVLRELAFGLLKSKMFPFGLWSSQVVFRAYFLLCTPELLREVLGGPYGVPGIKPRLCACKASAVCYTWYIISLVPKFKSLYLPEFFFLVKKEFKEKTQGCKCYSPPWAVPGHALSNLLTNSINIIKRPVSHYQVVV